MKTPAYPPRPAPADQAATARSLRRYTIRSGLLRLSAACAIPAILVAVALLAHDFQVERDRAFSDATLIARNVASDVDTELSGIESGLRILATSPELQSGDMAAFHRRAVDALRFQGVINYALTDRSGRQLVNTLLPVGAPLATNKITPATLKVLDDRATVISGLFTGPVSGQPVVAVGVPVQIGSDVPYALGAGVHVERLGGVLQRQAFRESWIVAVLDAKGTIVARSRDAERFVGQKAVPALLDAATSSPQGTLESITKDGTPVFTAFVRAPKSNWIVAVGAPKAQLMGALYQSLAWLLAGSALAIGGGLWLAMRLAGQLSAAVRGWESRHSRSAAAGRWRSRLRAWKRSMPWPMRCGRPSACSRVRSTRRTTTHSPACATARCSIRWRASRSAWPSATRHRSRSC